LIAEADTLARAGDVSGASERLTVAGSSIRVGAVGFRRALVLLDDLDLPAVAREIHATVRADPGALREIVDPKVYLGGSAGATKVLSAVEARSTAWPLDGEARFVLGWLKMQLGDTDGAQSEFEALLKADPSYPFAKSFLRSVTAPVQPSVGSGQ